MANTEFDICSERFSRYEQAAARRRYAESHKTANGGWTKEFIEKLGYKWPPTKGWLDHYARYGGGNRD